MGVVVDRLGAGFGHGHLAGALRAAAGGDGGMPGCGERGLRQSATTLRPGGDTRAVPPVRSGAVASPGAAAARGLPPFHPVTAPGVTGCPKILAVTEPLPFRRKSPTATA